MTTDADGKVSHWRVPLAPFHQEIAIATWGRE
jgi:hypothetical protein